MKRIRIIHTPPGFADEHIRLKWIGVEIPLPTAEQLAENPPSGLSIGRENEGGYLVRTEDAVIALHNAGKHEVADFWGSCVLDSYLRFSRDVCEEID